MKKAILTSINENLKDSYSIFAKNFTPMKSVFKHNKELVFLKEEFKAFVEEKNKKETLPEKQIELKKEAILVLEETS